MDLTPPTGPSGRLRLWVFVGRLMGDKLGALIWREGDPAR